MLFKLSGQIKQKLAIATKTSAAIEPLSALKALWRRFNN